MINLLTLATINGNILISGTKTGTRHLSRHTNKHIPFYFSTARYGLFVNHPGYSEVEFEAGSEKVSRVMIVLRGESLGYLVIYVLAPLEVRSPSFCWLPLPPGSKKARFVECVAWG
jgi:hypothetical protein